MSKIRELDSLLRFAGDFCYTEVGAPSLFPCMKREDVYFGVNYNCFRS